MKKPKYSKQFLDELRKVPNVLNACKIVGIARQTVYRWCREDHEFELEMDKAMKEGIANMNDMTESQLLRMAQEKNWPAVRFWLQHRHPSYKQQSDNVPTAKLNPPDKLNDEELKTMEAMLAKFMKVKKNSSGKKYTSTK
jgi:hypothetical protein